LLEGALSVPPATRVGDTTVHGGTVTGPGVATVLIGGQPACVAGDMHACTIPPNTGHLPVSAFPSGSTKVMIGGRPAIRVGDTAICGATAAVGAPTVMIG
jgi:uncharacterized Zn-binding protein involved in type VI secretion